MYTANVILIYVRVQNERILNPSDQLRNNASSLTSSSKIRCQAAKMS